METRHLGRTNLTVSALGFGCGAIGGLFVKGSAEEQRRAFDQAVAAGITYFDTAPGYGDGRSEENLGKILAETRAPVVVGTKVRLSAGDLADVRGAVRKSLEASLRRLRRGRVDLVQLHNRIGLKRDNRGGTLAVEDVLGPVAVALRTARNSGLAGHVGFTGLGEPAALARVIDAGVFDTVQAYFNAANPSAGWAGRQPPGAEDFGGLIDRASAAGLGVIVIRPLAAGALAASDERHPSAGSPGSPLVPGGDYAADQERARALAEVAAAAGLEGPAELALRFALSKPGVSTVIVGFSDSAQLADALRWAERGPLASDVVERILGMVASAGPAAGPKPA